MQDNSMFNIYDRLARHCTSLAVIGTGYVGSPVVAAFAPHFNTIGYDIDSALINRLCSSLGQNAELSTSEDVLYKASFFIVTVATPVDNSKKPDISQLTKASETIGSHLKRGDYVVFESTVSPGCTEDVCIPILEKTSGLKAGRDFKAGYSPERINPGDPLHTFCNTEKIVGAIDNVALAEIIKVYSTAISAQIHKASSIRVAEAAKIMENVQRGVNIALMNELYQLFHKTGIDFDEVLRMASTKWNFFNCHPGLVGGHCIPVDPYYLLAKASELGTDIPVTAASCKVNDSMARYIARSAIDSLPKQYDTTLRPKILIMGVTYKPDTDDIRNSQAAELYRCLADHSAETHVTDPYADPCKVFKHYGIRLKALPEPPYDIIISAVPHSCMLSLDDSYFSSLSASPDSIMVDIGCVYKDKIFSIKYQGV